MADVDSSRLRRRFGLLSLTSGNILENSYADLADAVAEADRLNDPTQSSMAPVVVFEFVDIAPAE